MEPRLYEVIDSRGVSWIALLSGPTQAGVLQQGSSLDSLPEIFLLRLRREKNAEHEIVIDLQTEHVSADEAKVLLEQQPEWLYEEWAMP